MRSTPPRYRSVLLALSILAWPWLVQWWALDYLARAEQLGALLGRLTTPPPSPEAQLPPVTEPERPIDFELGPVAPAVPSRAPTATPVRRTRSRQAAARRGIRVRGASILRLARARAIPGSATVPARPPRPAGLMLQGVSGLGVGMQDGDVITSVAGAGVSTRSEIVTAVMHARARRAKEISAVFWRAEVPWSLVVEMPYPTRRRRPSGDTGQKPR